MSGLDAAPSGALTKAPTTVSIAADNVSASAFDSLPKDELPQIMPAVAAHALKILAAEGLSAFESPKSAAIAHEVGHTIVGAHDGLSIIKVSIKQTPRLSTGHRPWTGQTLEAAPWNIGPQTPLTGVLRRIRMTIAGEIGEFVLDRDNYRAATSLDEVALSQRMALHAVAAYSASDAHLQQQAERLWNAMRRRCADIIKENRALASTMMTHLDRVPMLRGRTLQTLLAKVRLLDFPF